MNVKDRSGGKSVTTLVTHAALLHTAVRALATHPESNAAVQVNTRNQSSFRFQYAMPRLDKGCTKSKFFICIANSIAYDVCSLVNSPPRFTERKLGKVCVVHARGVRACKMNECTNGELSDRDVHVLSILTGARGIAMFVCEPCSDQLSKR